MREPSQRMFEAVSEGRLAATTSTEVIQEFVHVRSRRRSRGDAVERARSFLRLLRPLQSCDERTMERGLDLFVANDRLGGFDAALAAIALDQRASLVSPDRAFASVPGLHHLDPGADGFLADLGVG